MRLILHAGTHKTGTSTLQRLLDRDRARLLELGIWYPDSRPHFGGDHPGHHPLAHDVAAHGEHAERARSFVDHLWQDAPPDGLVLLSAEPVYRHVLQEVPGPWWDRHRQYLEAFATVLRPFDVRPLLVFRRRDTFLESIYHERVSQGFAGSFTDLLERSGRLADYERQARVFREAFGTLDEVGYEDLSRDAGLVEGFYALLGVPAPDDVETGWQRRSPDARITLWMALRNQDDSREELVTQRRRFSKHPATRELLADFGRTTLWDDARARGELLRSYGDTAPVDDDRRPARLDEVTLARLDRAFRSYLEDKGLDSLAASVPAGR